jgi:hypothetical protein
VGWAAWIPWYLSVRFGGRMLLFPVLIEYRALFAMKVVEFTTLGILSGFSF